VESGQAKELKLNGMISKELTSHLKGMTNMIQFPDEAGLLLKRAQILSSPEKQEINAENNV
jgi:hypothetical protein